MQPPEINLICFGVIGEKCGFKEKKIVGPNNTEELVHWLEKECPEIKSLSYSIAVNRKMVHSSIELSHQCEVALLPPFSGG
ncbi:MAG: MoaD/ThiS family protein [Saprospiraceae bacterium]|nr:MoaD/ThiS family protein [Saprospiraceae bacterium]